MAQGLHIRRKRSFRPLLSWLFWLIVIILIATAGWIAYRWYTTGSAPLLPASIASAAQPKVDETPVTDADKTAYTVPPTNPRYISIADLDIGKTRVFPVGVTANNTLETPPNIDDAAWYDKSALPGSGYGAVLIDAHNGGYSRNGVFAKLDTLQKGAIVEVERGDGKVFRYKVVSNQTMPLDEVNKSGMNMMMQSANPDKEGLSLITCAGNYVPSIGQFDKRVMVRAVRAD